MKTLPLCESSREDVMMSIQQFISPRNPYQARLWPGSPKRLSESCVNDL